MMAENLTKSLIKKENRVLYINLVILDPSEAVKAKVTRDLEQQKMPKPIHNAMKKIAPSVASSLATPDIVASAMAKELPIKTVEKMKQKGITTVAETVFHEGPFVVIQMQVQHVSTEAMIEAQSRNFYDDDDGTIEEHAKISVDWAERIISCIRRLFTHIGMSNQERIERDYLPNMVQSKMEIMMDEIMADKLQQKGLQAASKILSEEKESRFFFETLNTLRLAKIQNHPLNKLKLSFMEFKKQIGPSKNTSNSSSTTTEQIEDDDDIDMNSSNTAENKKES